jgi:hypothetical protein
LIFHFCTMLFFNGESKVQYPNSSIYL